METDQGREDKTERNKCTKDENVKKNYVNWPFSLVFHKNQLTSCVHATSEELYIAINGNLIYLRYVALCFQKHLPNHFSILIFCNPTAQIMLSRHKTVSFLE